MVHCCVPECTNHSGKTKSVSYHKVPSDKKLRKAWLDRLRRANLPSLENCYVCSDHFDKSCFKLSFREQLTGERGKRRLNADAVPSIFVFNTCVRPSKRRSTTEDRTLRKQRKETIGELLGVNTEPCVFMNEVEINTCHLPTPEDASTSIQSNHTREVGTQCCLDRPVTFSITTHASTQTDATCIEHHADGFINHNLPEGLECLDLLQLVNHDHSYAKNEIAEEEKPELVQIMNNNNCLTDKEEDHIDDGDETVDDNMDVEYLPSDDQQSSTDTDSENEHLEKGYVDEVKYLVFQSSLKQLFKYCLNCGEPVVDYNTQLTGSLVSVSTTCMKGHKVKWNSQPVLTNQSPVGNLLISSSILFTGNTFNAIKNFASCLNLKLFSEKTFYNIQDRYLFPAINCLWEKKQEDIIHDIQAKPMLKLNGDGRCDSPGHNAKYGTYTMMDSDTGKVVEFKVVQVSEVTSSNAMEKEGFERCLTSLDEKEVRVHTITTDRHIGINSAMDKVHTNIRHQYDVWHFSKSIVKKLNKRAKMKKNQDLAPWIQSVNNHLWWCAATCDGNAQLLKEKWLSLLNHITNKHSWRRKPGQLFKKCGHAALTRAEKKATAWLKPGSSAFVALEEVITNPKLLAGLPKLTDFCHTGGLEVYHSMMLKYAPKREHFSYNGMIARTQLAAIDNNENAGRGQAVIKQGVNAGAARYRKCFPKMHKRWVVKPILQAKTYAFLPELQRSVLQNCQDGKDDPIEPDVDLPQNIASEPAPNKQELIRRHRSRFNRT